MNAPLQILTAKLLAPYLEQVPLNLEPAFAALADAEISTDSFDFYVSVASVFSSKIEGESVELDSYIKHKRFGIEFAPDYTKKIDDLYAAYTFAQQHALQAHHIGAAHKLLSKHLVAAKWQGELRTQNMYVTTPAGKIEYVAAPYVVAREMAKFYADVAELLRREMSMAECFYYAALIHLVFVKIHPWNDGNGRTGRLLEKWFLSQKLGPQAWFIASERMYYQQHQQYYHNLRRLGLEYETLDYAAALPFLLMLPRSLEEG